ncbi:MAG: NfeD family protein [Alphaproteobacteria bacterium]|nr:NfeD family protein [Alphaproteobacteria bacterium]
MDITAVEIWLLIGVIFIIIEFSKIPGIGFLFLGLGALTTSALISSYSEITDYQIATFGLVSFAWFLVQWWPLKKFVYGKKKENGVNQGYFDLVGNQVTVFNQSIEPGKIGQVSWSGTIMNAKLADSEKEQGKPGDVLYVLEVKGNILICSHKKP